MKKPLLLLCFLFLPVLGQAVVLDNHTGVYATWWDADGLDDGTGIGLGKDVRLLGIVFVEGNAGYVDFEGGWVVPLEVSLNLKLPLPLTPYFGVGVGYYLTDHNRVDSDVGSHLKLGAMASLFGLGVYGEARSLDLEEDALDGYSVLLGVSLNF